MYPSNYGGYVVQWGQGGQDKELNTRFQEEAKAEQEVANLMAQYSHTEDDAERAKIKPKLAAALGKQFEAQQQRRAVELKRLEAQLKKLRDLMEKRSEQKQTIIDKRLDQIVREAEGLGWSPPPSGARWFGSTNGYGVPQRR
jgi:hypothetical protein